MAKTPAAVYPLSKTVIAVLCLATPFTGSILAYVWKSDHPSAAQYARNLSSLGWRIWLFALVVFKLIPATRY